MSFGQQKEPERGAKELIVADVAQSSASSQREVAS
jgi:hypothetical protein